MEGSVPLALIVTFAFALLLLIVLTVVVVRLHKRLTKFVQGKDGASLEATAEWLTKKVAGIEETLETHHDALTYMDKRIERSVRGYSLIRYDAYIGAGGQQSFSAALLDERGDGFIFSSVSNRNHTNSYAKKIIAGTPETSLTDEESLVLKEARRQTRPL